MRELFVACNNMQSFNAKLTTTEESSNQPQKNLTLTKSEARAKTNVQNLSMHDGVNSGIVDCMRTLNQLPVVHELEQQVSTEQGVPAVELHSNKISHMEEASRSIHSMDNILFGYLTWNSDYGTVFKFAWGEKKILLERKKVLILLQWRRS